MSRSAVQWRDLDNDQTLRAFRDAQRRSRRRSTGAGDAQVGSTATSFSASFARSFVLLLGECTSQSSQIYLLMISPGVYFKRPSRLFRPTRGEKDGLHLG